MAVMSVNLTSPDKVREFDDIEFASFDAINGSIGILPNHTDILGRLKTGMLKLTSARGIDLYAISGGFFEVRSGKLTILADSAERSDEVDVERALAAKRKAEEDIRKADQQEWARAQAALLRALNRLKVAGKL